MMLSKEQKTRSSLKLAVFIILAAMVTCQVESIDYHGDVSGQVFDGQGNPLSDVLVSGTSANISVVANGFPSDSAFQNDFLNRDSTDIHGAYQLSNSVKYSTEGELFGCGANENDTKVTVFYLEFSRHPLDTFVVFFSPAHDTTSENISTHYSQRADTVILLEISMYENERTPDVYALPDIFMR